MRQDADGAEGRDTSDLVGKFLSVCHENQNDAHWESFAT
jgi:hypothetical protein